MKKLITLYILFLLIATPTAFAGSSITIETTINENVYVTFNFTDIELQLYNETKMQGFNVSTIPKAIEENFEQQNLKNARVNYDLNQKIFNDTTSSIYVEFLLTGSDILSYNLNKTDMTRTFRVRTDWRKIKINFTNDFPLDFGEYFGASLSSWQKVTVYERVAFEKNVVEDEIAMSFHFILPKEAFDVQDEEDTIIFKVPLVFEDTLLNSPFLILGALIIANIIFVAYRKARK